MNIAIMRCTLFALSSLVAIALIVSFVNVVRANELGISAGQANAGAAAAGVAGVANQAFSGVVTAGPGIGLSGTTGQQAAGATSGVGSRSAINGNNVNASSLGFGAAGNGGSSASFSATIGNALGAGGNSQTGLGNGSYLGGAGAQIGAIQVFSQP